MHSNKLLFLTFDLFTHTSKNACMRNRIPGHDIDIDKDDEVNYLHFYQNQIYKHCDT